MCESCRYLDSNPDKKPCSVCIKWIDGYREFTQYKEGRVKAKFEPYISDEDLDIGTGD